MRMVWREYFFVDPKGKTVSIVMEAGELERRLSGGSITHNGQKMRLKEGANPTIRPRHGIAEWPMRSVGAGCHPKQISKMEADSRKKGVPTRFASNGDAIFESRSHRRNYLRAYGMHDRDGGYGD